MTRSSRKGAVAPPRPERAALDAARAARRTVAEIARRRGDVDAAREKIRSALAWIEEAERAVEHGEAAFGDPVFGLTHHAAGAREKRRALAETLKALDRQAAALAEAAGEAERAVSESRLRLRVLRRGSRRKSGAVSKAV